jgi:hypothetical protein
MQRGKEGMRGTSKSSEGASMSLRVCCAADMLCPMTCPPNTAWLPGGVQRGFLERKRLRSSTSSSRAPMRPRAGLLLLLDGAGGG